MVSHFNWQRPDTADTIQNKKTSNAILFSIPSFIVILFGLGEWRAVGIIVGAFYHCAVLALRCAHWAQPQPTVILCSRTAAKEQLCNEECSCAPMLRSVFRKYI